MSTSITGLDAPGVGRHVQPQQSSDEEESDTDALASQGGPLLDLPDEEAFKVVDDLVLRQESLARNRWAIDTHWGRVKQGYPWSRLEKVQDQDIYRAVVPPGTNVTMIAAVPNKAWDLLNKTVETLLVDVPKPLPQSTDDSEEALRAAEMAKDFLTQDGGEQGTNDAQTFWDAEDMAMTRSSCFEHLWVDPVGGGYVPFSIKAHPQAQSPQNPDVGPDGMPTTDPVLRFVTSKDLSQAQFTDDPSQAPPQWIPKIRRDLMGREHVRIFPETADVAKAQKVICIWHCTLGEALRRWPDVLGTMSPEELGQLCDWTPRRYFTILPPALRSRWKLQTGDTSDPKGSSNDERTLFVYIVYVRPDTDYPHGAYVVLNGANGGVRLHAEPWTATVPTTDGKGTDVRCLEMPIVQFRPIADTDELDPTGQALLKRFAGTSEASSTLVTAYEEALDITLHPARYTTINSPISADDVQESRATGVHLAVQSKDDYPFYEPPPTLPASLMGLIEWLDERMDSISGLTKPAQGDDRQQEVSGVARQIAVRQALVSLGRMQQALADACSRHWRIKLQLALKYFDAPQQLRITGEDGSYKQQEWTGLDFATVETVTVAPGTGTMQTPQDKVNTLGSLVQQRFMTAEEASDAARPAYETSLGLPGDATVARIEREIAAWYKGPPPGWMEQYQQYQEEMQQIQLVQQSQMADWQTRANMLTQNGLPAPPQPQPPQPQTPPPWTPFNQLPCDSDAIVAGKRLRRLAQMMQQARFSMQPVPWQQTVFTAYNQAAQAIQAQTPPPPLPRGVQIQASATPQNIGQLEKAATSSPQPQSTSPQQGAAA